MNYIEITLTKGKTTIIDCDDFDRVSRKSWRATIAGHGRGGYYATAHVKVSNRKYTSIMLHRFILNAPKGVLIDHINGDTLDNRKENLRFCGASQNASNSRKTSLARSSKFKGVTWSKQKNKWHAQIYRRGKNKNLGLFDDEAIAALAYDKAHLLLDREFARPNFPKSILDLIPNSVVSRSIERAEGILK